MHFGGSQSCSLVQQQRDVDGSRGAFDDFAAALLLSGEREWVVTGSALAKVCSLSDLG